MIGAAIYTLFGLVVGSFLNVVADRLPAKASLLYPASRCPACGRPLSPWELVPVFSYLALRGRCRTCSASIPLRVPLVELATGALFGFLWWTYGPTLRMGLYTLYSCILLVIMVIDLEHKLVLNVVILPATAFALLTVLLQRWMAPPPVSQYAVLWAMIGGKATGLSPVHVTMLSQVAGGVTAFLIFFVIWLVAPGGMGAGDVKLAAFAGLITAFPGALTAVFGSFILGGVVGVILLLTRAAGRKTAIPFAPFLVVATFVVMVYGDRLLLWYLAH